MSNFNQYNLKKNSGKIHELKIKIGFFKVSNSFISWFGYPNAQTLGVFFI